MQAALPSRVRSHIRGRVDEEQAQSDTRLLKIWPVWQRSSCLCQHAWLSVSKQRQHSGKSYSASEGRSMPPMTPSYTNDRWQIHKHYQSACMVDRP